MRRRAYGWTAATLCAAVGGEALAHHSPFIFFDPSTTIEATGTVTRVHWRNPHVTFTVESEDASWEIEANSVSILRRMDLTADVVQVGDTVTVAGWPPKQAEHSMFLTNMLIGGGPEIIFWPGTPPRWSDNTAGTSQTWMVTEADLTADAPEGIFRVWSTTLAYGPENFLFEGFDFPLTDAAQAARAAYDLADSPILGSCVHKGMPTIMEQPYPMALVPGDGVIYLRMEEGDAVRTIDMAPGASPARAPSPMGHSVGRWEGETLAVTTTASTWPHIDMTGVPNTEDTVMVERFTPSADGRRLDYTLTLTNPAIFTAPPTFTKHWLWLSEATVEPYACEVEADR